MNSNHLKNPRHGAILDVDSQECFLAYKAHCEAGWSPRSFLNRISGGERNYQRAIRTKIEWFEIHNKHRRAGGSKIEFGSDESFRIIPGQF